MTFASKIHIVIISKRENAANPATKRLSTRQSYKISKNFLHDLSKAHYHVIHENKPFDKS
jgi:hypothetical protein